MRMHLLAKALKRQKKKAGKLAEMNYVFSPYCYIDLSKYRIGQLKYTARHTLINPIINVQASKSPLRKPPVCPRV